MKADYSLLSGHLPQMQGKQAKWLIGIDEVGRGCLAGPVVVGASLWVLGSPSELDEVWQQQISDSKTISEKKREKIFTGVKESSELFVTEDIETENRKEFSVNHIKSKFMQILPDRSTVIKSLDDSLNEEDDAQKVKCIGTAVESASEREIEQHNIWESVQIAAGRALLRLLKTFPDILNNLEDGIVVMDGHKAIKVPNEFQKTPQLCVVKGDLHFASVGLASICAKVSRDHYMMELGRVVKNYGLEKHKGYATKVHREAIQKHGPTEHHRMSFLGNILNNEEIRLF